MYTIREFAKKRINSGVFARFVLFLSGIVIGVPKNKFGLPGCENLDVVNLKCNPLLLGSLLGEKGFFPAYHMSGHE